MAIRRAARVFPAQQTIEGDGVNVRRAFPISSVDSVDPFLLLDHMGPIDFAPGQKSGFPPHPHRGFETVTYLLSGQFDHHDSFGNRGKLNAGDVQWMTAGSGLVHSETPGSDLVRDGGQLEGFQLWVNLPKSEKMTAPGYQEVAGANLPLAVSADGKVRVKIIAGSSMGRKAAIGTRTPILYLHFTLAPGATHVQEVPSSYSAFAYVFRGALPFAKAGEVAIFDDSGDTVELSNEGVEPLELLLIAGEPLKEPVMRYGPFVMNTRDELVEAFEDYRSGKMGVLDE